MREGQVFASAHHTPAAPVVKRASRFDKSPDTFFAPARGRSQACGENATSMALYYRSALFISRRILPTIAIQLLLSCRLLTFNIF
jgi:hypothetical protein